MDDGTKSATPDWVKEASGREDEEVREIYALAGLALYLAQVLEHGIVNCLAGLELMRVGRSGIKRVNEEVDQLWDDNFRLTLGRLVDRINSRISISPELKGNLEKSIEVRNALVHRFFREHSTNLITAEGRRFMARMLEEMRDQFSFTTQQLDLISDDLWKALGVTPDMIDRIVKLAESGMSDDEIDRLLKRERQKSSNK
jgi:hypothetical protein